MNVNVYFSILAPVLIAHIFLTFFASIETLNYPLFSKLQKLGWFVIVWALPIFGSIWVHKKLGLKWGASSSGGGDTMLSDGSSSNGGGCGGDSDGSCH
jgi:uncharacterized membrane protein YgcG